MRRKEDVPAQDALPILLGVVGKRQLSATARAAFDERFAALLDRLDRVLPDTPKLLVCGGAAGTDLAAVRLVLGTGRAARPGWAVALVLPFDDANFEQDFDAAEFAGDLATLRRLRARVADDDRLIVKRMRLLHRDSFEDGRLEPQTPDRFAAEALRKSPPGGPHNDARSMHFEQLGLWLARYATLLVAVGPAEEARPGHAHRLGGTARVVAYRRTATPDEAAEKVIARSSELLSGSPFEEPDGGYVLWLDPTAASQGQKRGLPGVSVLRPIQRVVDVGSPAIALSDVVDGIYAKPMHDPYDDAVEHRRRGRGALALAHAFQGLHARRRGVVRRFWRRPPSPIAGKESPVAFLEQVRRGTLRTQQYAAAAWTRRAQRSSALLFFLALAGFETYTELAEDASWLLAGYILLLLGIAGIAMLMRDGKVQVRGEDYRGLQEMLRVQIAWWAAGIDRMVDRVHLRTIDTDLRLVREAAAAITMWAVLRCKKLDTLDAVTQPDPDAALRKVAGWIDDQVEFFAKRAKPQYGAKRLAETAFGLTLTAALSVLALLWATTMFAPDLPEHLVSAAPLALAALPLVGALMAAGVWYGFTGRWIGRRKAGPVEAGVWGLTMVLSVIAGLLAALVELQAVHAWLGEGLALPAWALWRYGWAAPLSFGCVLAVLLMMQVRDVTDFDVQMLQARSRVVATAALVGAVLLAAVAFAPIVDHAAPAEALGKLVMVEAVLLLGGTGMVRWYTERRNHLAQAGQYDDMLRVFRRAQDWLRKRHSPLDRQAQEHVVKLGELALGENEAWLKAHRDRPAEPIAGA